MTVAPAPGEQEASRSLPNWGTIEAGGGRVCDFCLSQDRDKGRDKAILLPPYSGHQDLGILVLEEWTLGLDISELAPGPYVIRFGDLEAAFTV